MTVIFELLGRLFGAVVTAIFELFVTVVFELLGRLFGAIVMVFFERLGRFFGSVVSVVNKLTRPAGVLCRSSTQNLEMVCLSSR